MAISIKEQVATAQAMPHSNEEERKVRSQTIWKARTPEPKTEPPTELASYTPAEIALSTPAEPEWVVRGYLAKGAITELDGKVKAAGKTTFTLDEVRSIIDGEPFLGQPTAQTNVVYITEQSRSSFLHALNRAALTGHTNGLHVVFHRELKGIAWPDLIRLAIIKCQQVEADVLVIDTIARIADVKGENDTDGWSTAMQPLMNAANAENLAIQIARHSRKSGGDVGDTGRGSSSASGDVDIILELKRPEGNQAGTNRRVLESLSRYDQTPDKIVIELQTQGYVYVGEEDAVSLNDAKRAILDALTQAGTALKKDQIVMPGSTISDGSFNRAAKDMLAKGEITAKQLSTRGKPYEYALPVERVERVSPRSLSFPPRDAE